VLEFGSGSSTIWFADRAGHITSFEHDPLWFDVVGAESAKRLNVDHRLLTRPYSEHVADLPDESFDLVLVDGRDRVRCALAAIRTLKPGGLMVVDNIDREYYAPISTALAAWRRLDFPTGAPHTSAWVKPQSASFRTVPLTHGR
jgi:predicted O-methyltransferase YrrM